MLLLIGVLVLVIVMGCSTSGPADVKGLREVIGISLPGAKGLTLDDQRKIDLTVAGGCGGRIFTKEECRRHGASSWERKNVK
jgi:hypothetical protein